MRLRQILTLIVVAIVLIAGILVVWRVSERTIARQVAAMATPEEKEIDLGTAVTRVRELNRLETASMRVVHVSTLSQTYDLVPNSLGGDELTFFATGDVIAGIDLSALKPTDAYRQPDGTLVLKLPSAQILVSRLDNRESHVINRKTGFLRRSDVNLESRARQYAEQGIRNEAMHKGILPLASQNAQTRLAAFLHTLGFQKVRFIDDTPQAPGQG